MQPVCQYERLVKWKFLQRFSQNAVIVIELEEDKMNKYSDVIFTIADITNDKQKLHLSVYLNMGSLKENQVYFYMV